MIFSKVAVSICIPGILLNPALFAQKKIKTPDELKKVKVYRTLDEAAYNKKKVYKLNLDGQNLDEIPEQVFKMKNLQELDFNGSMISNLGLTAYPLLSVP